VREAAGLDDRFLLEGSYELIVGNKAYPASIGLQPFLDPANERVKA
jgi:hypothetical protein